MAALRTDIVADILSRLPVKSIIRFKCVCKSWDSLIKTPNFIKLHLNKTLLSNSDRRLLVSSPWSSLYSADPDLNRKRLSFSELHHPLKPYKVATLVGSCNGVVCISDESKNDVFLYNPLTKSRRKLPVNRIPNPNINFALLGFGYDNKNNDYKVLKLVQGLVYTESFYTEAKVYSLNTNSWKSVADVPYFLHYRGFNGLLVNEVLHYIVVKQLESPIKFIAGFNLRTESFSLIECPKDDNILRSDLMLFLSELGGCLSLLVNIHTRDLANMSPMILNVEQYVDRVDLWVMKEYGKKESWVRLFSIRDPERFEAHLEIKPVVYSKDGRKVLLEIDGVRCGWYDYSSNKYTRCTVHGRPEGVGEMLCFMGSLVSLEDKGELAMEEQKQG
ncbi:hypothetical protein SOVF_166390 [Spinacia oleracea]|nr:hypothetical protein SOVF_166390 [Spinacia oleracea]